MCHPALVQVLPKMFNITLKCGPVPEKCGSSCTVPIHVGDYVRGRYLKADDFRGISSGPVISNLFETSNKSISFIV